MRLGHRQHRLRDDLLRRLQRRGVHLRRRRRQGHRKDARSVFRAVAARRPVGHPASVAAASRQEVGVLRHFRSVGSLRRAVARPDQLLVEFFFNFLFSFYIFCYIFWHLKFYSIFLLRPL